MLAYRIFLASFLLYTSSALQLGTKPKIGRVQAGPITISQLGCGTWSWGNRLLFDYDTSQDEEIYEAYKRVRDAGVTVFDTADSYGTLDLNGRAEILLGEFERRYQEERNDIETPWWEFNKQSDNSNAQQVATKFAPYPWRITRGSLLNAAEASLKRLGQSKLAIAQLHWSTANYQPFQGTTKIVGEVNQANINLQRD